MRALAVVVLVSAGATASAAEITVEGSDSAAIAAAIDRSQAGDTVTLPAGEYSITDPIRPKSGTQLIG